MIGICPACGNYEWDKLVSENVIRCPKCSHTWKFKKLPLFVLTGCSGVGKTTAGQELLLRGERAAAENDGGQRYYRRKMD